MDTERNLLFGVLAVNADFLEPAQLAEAYRAWAAHPAMPLSDFLLARGALSPEQKSQIADLEAHTLAGHGGDVRATLRAIDAQVWRTLTSLNEPSWDGTIAGLDLPAAVDARDATVVRDRPAESAISGDQRYRRLRIHAAGGIGQVWLARDRHLDRDVALKELRPESIRHNDARTRFVAEARVTGQLEHPGIVPVYELAGDESGAEPYYVMRFVKGRTLSADIQTYHASRREGKASTLALNSLLQAFVAVCQAVAYAHARGVIHRDLKGANVILGDFGEVMVLDWGLAKKVGSEDPSALAGAEPGTVVSSGVLTLKGQVLGTPAYMAPEQASAGREKTDERTDVYGLGAILYEILTGRPPFSFSATVPGRETRQLLNVHDLLRKIREEDPPRPRELNAAVPPALEAICVRALNKKPDRRYAAAGDLARDIQRWLADEPVTAYREPVRTRLGRWARRHKPVVAGAAVLLVAAIVALSVSNILIGREQARTQEMATKADENFREARDVVDRFFVRIGKDRLLNEPGFQPLRRELLQMAGEYYEKFERTHAEDPAVKPDLAQALFQLARITSDLGDNAEAVAIIDRAGRLFEGLMEQRPGSGYEVFVARCQNRKGAYYTAAGDLKRAEEAFAKACGMLELVEQRQPMDATILENLAFAQGNLGVVYRRLGNDELARRPLEKSLQSHLRLLELQPDNPTYQHDVVGSHINLAGYLFEVARQKDKAAEQVREAMRITRALAVKYPKVIEYQQSLGKCYRTLARMEGDEAEAVALLQKALEIRRRIARENPNVTQYQTELAEGYVSLGRAFHAAREREGTNAKTYADKSALAKQAFGQARDIFEKLSHDYVDVPAFTENLGWVYSILGDFFLPDDVSESHRYYEKAVRRLEKITPSGSTTKIARVSLRNAYWGLAEIESKAGAADKALPLWKLALKNDDGSQYKVLRPKMQQAWIALARSWSLKGDHKRALEEVDALAREPALTGPVLAQGAEILVAAANAEKDPQTADRLAATAIALLVRADAAGVFQAPAAVRGLERLGELPLFRDRGDYRGLLKKVKGHL